MKCQGNVTMDILCANYDCPIYYKRIKIKKDFYNKKSQMDRLNTLSIEYWMSESYNDCWYIIYLLNYLNFTLSSNHNYTNQFSSHLESIFR